MSKVGCILLLAMLIISACQPRKSGLLPPRSELKAEAASSGVNNPGLSAKAVPGDSHEQKVSLGSPVSPSVQEAEIDDLEDVKQEALDRIKKFPNPGDKDRAAPNKKAAQVYRRGVQLTASGNIDEAREYYLIACQLGLAEGCHKFGWHEQQSGNAANARQFYKTACVGGLSKSCNNLAIQLEKLRNWDEALDFYARACLEKHSVSCENMKRLRMQRLHLR